MKAGTRDAQKNLLDKTLAEEQSKSLFNGRPPAHSIV